MVDRPFLSVDGERCGAVLGEHLAGWVLVGLKEA